MHRKDFIKRIGLAGVATSVLPSLSTAKPASRAALRAPHICTLIPAETLGPFPSLPSGDAMYWRSNIIDGQAGVQLTFTIKLFGTTNCGIMQNYRVDVWHCNADGFYSHYATGGTNNGHSGNNPPSNNANLIYCRGSQVTNSNGEVTFTTIFPGWYPGRTCHIHMAVYSGGQNGSPNGWVQQRVSQFTFPIDAKNTLYTSNAPYSTYGADPLHPNNDNVFSTPAGEWQLYQLGTLSGSGAGPYTSYFEMAITGSGVAPLELIGFNGTAMSTDALLWWKTAREQDFSHFEVEHSLDGEDFEFVGRVASKGNGLDTESHYSFEDANRLLYGNAFYRLKIVDLDGTAQYSSILPIKAEDVLAVRLYPVPAKDYVILSHPHIQEGAQVMILNGAGKIMSIGSISGDSDSSRLALDDYARGVYYLIVVDGQRSQTLKFLLN